MTTGEQISEVSEAEMCEIEEWLDRVPQGYERSTSILRLVADYRQIKHRNATLQADQSRSSNRIHVLEDRVTMLVSVLKRCQKSFDPKREPAMLVDQVIKASNGWQPAEHCSDNNRCKIDHAGTCACECKPCITGRIQDALGKP